MPELFADPRIHWEKGENLMHSGGHNALIRKMSGEYYFCVGYDMLYAPDFVRQIVSELEKKENQHYGSATCKLMQWDFGKAEKGNLEGSKTNQIDSFGIACSPAHHFYDLGQSFQDQGQYADLGSVFGPSGALTVFRRKTLEDIAFRNGKGELEYYDEQLHYKNDVDLAYRMQWAGHDCLLVQTTTVYHDRQVDNKDRANDKIELGNLKNHHAKAQWVKANSLMGHLTVLRKNVKGVKFSLSVRLKTFFSQIARFLYTVSLSPSLLKEYAKASRMQAENLEWRKQMKWRRKPAEIEEMMK